MSTNTIELLKSGHARNWRTNGQLRNTVAVCKTTFHRHQQRCKYNSVREVKKEKRRESLARNKKCSFQHLDIRTSPVKRNVAQHSLLSSLSVVLAADLQNWQDLASLPDNTREGRREREIWQNLTSTVSLSFKPSLPFCCHRKGYIIVKSQSNLFVLASQSSPLLSAAFNCLMCLPTEKASA